MKNIFFSKKNICLLALLFVCLTGRAQDTLLRIKVSELMDLGANRQEAEIVSASKRAEKLFESALSVSVISRQDMINAGCLSVPEALRLAGGMIIRETSRGNFDLYIQGLDNIKPFGSQFALAESTSILVMIDGRPVYSYFQGGTFWETLPVDLADIDAIEVVRGASSALYGANAVAGVINIITHKNNKSGVKARANVQYSTAGSRQISAYISDKLNPRWEVGTSFNNNLRNRGFDQYYRNPTDSYVAVDSLLFLGNTLTNKIRYPDVNISMDRSAVNLWSRYMPNREVQFFARGGWQSSYVQKIYADNRITPLTANTSRTSYLETTASGYGFTAQAYYNTGRQNVNGVAGWHYDFSTLFANLEYEKQFEALIFRFGLNYQSATYDDKPGADEFGIGRAFMGGTKNSLNSLGGFVRGEYTWNKFKIIGALRAEKYNSPDKTYFPFQVALTYQPNKNWIVRAVTSRANQGAFMLDNYFKQLAGSTRLSGNPNINLASLNRYEFGVRAKIAKSFLFDADIFQQRITDLAGFTVLNIGQDNYIDNYSIIAEQSGINLRFEYQKGPLIAKLSTTYQKTILHDFPASADYSQTAEFENKSTPNYSGNLYLNWKLSPKFRLNTTVYYLGEQLISSIIPSRTGQVAAGRSNMGTPSFAVFTGGLSFNPNENLIFSLNARNLNFGSKRQTFHADDILPEVYLGVNAGF